ncbi:DUF3558 domain-containing protein [Nocardia gipuzkoensis]|uniref:DUF3558 domain-containing protein n=1 Tax=Nocardia gipuzkoensis TaxID=2749991 RepID=UPI001E4E5585|nr:DUF3558 domain-containing protein [Nocardia gipuzkoensis]UGT65385.1 DUF3558 domain-containing protein [Nocardia gipuzkoensis]
MSGSEHRVFRPTAGFAAAAALAVLLIGCGDETTSSQNATSMTRPNAAGTETSSTAGPGSQTSFDPCTALTPQFLADHQWDALPPVPKQNSTSGISWKGCRYVARAGYSLTIQTTNGTLDQVKERFPSAIGVPIGRRNALRYEARPDVPGGCTVNVELHGGSLYILVDDPSGKHPRKLSPCDNATDIARAVAPLLPAGS